MLKSSPPTRLGRGLAAVLLSALSVGGGYAAWAAQAEPALITAPDWVDRPGPEDLVRVFPQPTGVERMLISVTTECRVESSGTLSACRMVDVIAECRSETPGACQPIREALDRDRFGAAVLQLTPKFRMKAVSRDGMPTAGGIIRIPIMFRYSPPPVN